MNYFSKASDFEKQGEKNIKYSKASEITFDSLPVSPTILQTSPFPNNGYAPKDQKSTSKNKLKYQQNNTF